MAYIVSAVVDGEKVADSYEDRALADAQAYGWRLRGIAATVEDTEAPAEADAEAPGPQDAAPISTVPHLAAQGDTSAADELAALRAENARLRAEAAAMAADGAPVGEAASPASGSGQ